MNKRILRNTILLFVSVSAMISCKNDEKDLEEVKNPVQVEKGKLKIQSSEIEFDKIDVNQNSEKTFTIENIGDTSLKINSIELSGNNKNDFKISLTTPFSIDVKGSKEVKVVFTANSIGKKNAITTIKTDLETSTITLKAFVKDIKDSNKILVEGSVSEGIKDFYIGKYEITNNEFVKFLNIRKAHTDGTNAWIKLIEDDPYGFDEIVIENGVYKVIEDKDKFPVRFVSFYGAMEYAKWVEGDIPTYKQWVYAAKGGKEPQPTDWLYFGAKNDLALEEISWLKYNSDRKSKEVGTTIKSGNLGIYDMAGNVFEWIKLEDDLVAAIGSSFRSTRKAARVDYFASKRPKSDRGYHIGFRLVYSAKK